MAFIFDSDIGSITNVLTLDPDVNVLTIAGTQGLQLPTGTTVQRPTPSNGILRNNSTLNFPEVYSNGSWQPPGSKGSRGYATFFDDFLIDNAAATTPFSKGWTPISNGAGAGVNGISSVLSGSNAIGVVQVNTGTATGAAGYAGAYQSLQSNLFGYGSFYGEWRVQIPQLSTGAQEFVFYIGFIMLVSGGDQDNGVYFEYRQPSSTFWRMSTAFSGTPTKSNTTVTVTAGQWYKLGIEVNAAGTLASFFINGIAVGTINTNIPTTTLNTVGHGFYIDKTNGSGSRSAYIDYASMYYSLTTPR